MNLTAFSCETDADGIVLLTWDMPGRSMNVITQDVMRELGEVVDHVASDAAIKGCVITSGKATFSGGADLAMLEALGVDFARNAKANGYEVAMRGFFDASSTLS